MFPHQPSVVSGALTGIYVQIASSDETLQLATSEAYSLSVPVSGVAQITAPNVYAALRGLETLRHVVFFPFEILVFVCLFILVSAASWCFSTLLRGCTLHRRRQ
jgi:hypothetical protein